MPHLTDIRFDEFDGRLHATLHRPERSVQFSVPAHRRWSAERALTALLGAVNANSRRVQA